MVALPTATTASAPAPDADLQVIARSAATELARLLPSTVPLELAAYDDASAPAEDAVAVSASFVGALSAELVVVAQEAIADAVAGSDAALSVADALRPALEAASATLGAGVLDEAESGPLGTALAAEDVVAYALVPEAGAAPVAWFGIRVRRSPEPVPQQRGPATAPDGARERSAMRLLHDVEMVLTAEIGRTKLPVRQVLELVPGTVLELDRTAGSPADVMVNGRLVARGEVVVVDEDYGIRITEIVATEA